MFPKTLVNTGGVGRLLFSVDALCSCTKSPFLGFRIGIPLLGGRGAHTRRNGSECQCKLRRRSLALAMEALRNTPSRVNVCAVSRIPPRVTWPRFRPVRELRVSLPGFTLQPVATAPSRPAQMSTQLLRPAGGNSKYHPCGQRPASRRIDNSGRTLARWPMIHWLRRILSCP